MSETPTAEKAYTTLKALQLSGDDAGDDDDSSGGMGNSIAVCVLWSSIMMLWMLL